VTGQSARAQAKTCGQSRARSVACCAVSTKKRRCLLCIHAQEALPPTRVLRRTRPARRGRCRFSRKAALIAWPRALPLPRNSDSDGRAVLPGNPVGVRFLLAVLILMIVGLVAQGG
jgi:hypothetical protein